MSEKASSTEADKTVNTTHHEGEKTAYAEPLPAYAGPGVSNGADRRPSTAALNIVHNPLKVSFPSIANIHRPNPHLLTLYPHSVFHENRLMPMPSFSPRNMACLKRAICSAEQL